MSKDYLGTIKFNSSKMKINCCSTNNFDENYINVYPKLSERKKIQLIANYPEYDYKRIKKSICRKFNLKNVVLGSGSEDLVIRINQIAEIEKLKVIFVIPIFHRIIESYKGKESGSISTFDIFNYDFSDANIVWIANPNMFTGEVYNKDNLIRLFKAYPKTIFVVDEAGIFLINNWKKFTLLKATHSLNNLILLESFSKIHGLAGLRVGFATGNNRFVEKIREIGLTFPFSALSEFYVSSLLNSDYFFEKIRRKIHHHKEEIEKHLEMNKNIIIKKNFTNCIFLKFIKNAGKYKKLLNKSIYYLDLDSQAGVKEKGFIRLTVHSSDKINRKIKREIFKVFKR